MNAEKISLRHPVACLHLQVGAKIAALFLNSTRLAAWPRHLQKLGPAEDVGVALICGRVKMPDP